jgi:ion channel
MFAGGDLLRGQIPVGLLACLVNIGVHAVIMAVLTWTAHRMTARTETLHPRTRLVLVMMATVTVLMVAHVIEVGVWGFTYVWTETVQDRGDAYYLAFVNYTTLGYGDILPVRHWRLLGPMAAMNGVLLFGWSTAVIYDILRSVVRVIPLAEVPQSR